MENYNCVDLICTYHKWANPDNFIDKDGEKVADFGEILQELDELEELSKSERLPEPYKIMLMQTTIVITIRLIRALGRKVDRVTERLGLEEMGVEAWNDEWDRLEKEEG